MPYVPIPGGGSVSVYNYQTFVDYVQRYGVTQELQYLIDAFPKVAQWLQDYQAQQAALNEANETGNWNDYQGQVANNGWELTPEQTEYMNNQVAQQNTQQAQTFEEHMRDTNVTSTANQLQSVGLAAGTVAQTGFTNSNGVGAANNSFSNPAQQRAMAKYSARMQMARSVVGLVGQMASSGIYGASLGAVKHAGASIAASSAHSALNVLKNSKHPDALVEQLAKDGNNYQLNNLFGK